MAVILYYEAYHARKLWALFSSLLAALNEVLRQRSLQWTFFSNCLQIAVHDFVSMPRFQAPLILKIGIYNASRNSNLTFRLRSIIHDINFVRNAFWLCWKLHKYSDYLLHFKHSAEVIADSIGSWKGKKLDLILWSCRDANVTSFCLLSSFSLLLIFVFLNDST